MDNVIIMVMQCLDNYKILCLKVEILNKPMHSSDLTLVSSETWVSQSKTNIFWTVKRPPSTDILLMQLFTTETTTQLSVTLFFKHM